MKKNTNLKTYITSPGFQFLRSSGDQYKWSHFKQRFDNHEPSFPTTMSQRGLMANSWTVASKYASPNFIHAVLFTFGLVSLVMVLTFLCAQT